MTLTNVEDVVLRTAAISTDGVVYTIGGTPGAHAAMEMSSRGWLTNLGPPAWAKSRTDREWQITIAGRVAYARHRESISRSERTARSGRGRTEGAPQAPGSAAGSGGE